MERYQVSDRLEIQVNLANGNVVVVARDLTVRGTGLNLALDHVYNNQAGGAAGAFGAGWTSSYGDTKLVISSGHVDLHDPTGYVATYTKTGSTFTTPPGMDADLTLSGSTYTLTFHVSNAKWTFNSSGQWTAQTDRNGNHLTFAYSSGNLNTITDTQGRVTSLTTSSNRVTAITDPTGLSFGGFTYDSSGRLIRYTDRAGTPITLGYNGSGNLTSLTSPNGDTYALTYDSSQRVTSLVQPLPGGRTATWGYSYGTGTTTGTDPNGHTAVFHFDATGRQTSAVDQLGHTKSQTWTTNNSINATTNALTQSTTYSYDTFNNLTGTQLSTGSSSSIGYGDASHPYLPSSITDPQNSQLTLTYDTSGNLTKVHNPALNIDVLRRSYNANGTIATQTDATGTVTTLSYDSAGNLLTLAPPAPRGAIHYTYDTLSRVVTVTDGNGVTITYTYDRLDRIIQTTNTSGSDTDVRQTAGYDRNGNVTVTQVPNARVEYIYSPRNEVLENHTSTDWFNETVDYRYDAAGNLAWLEDPTGTTYYYYDVANRLTSVTTPHGDVITFSYDNADRRTATHYPGGAGTNVTYDAAGRVQYLDAIGAGNTLLNRSTYSYVFNGADSTLLRSLSGWVSPNPNGTAATFTYDGLNRLLTGGVYSYSYDSRSNLTYSSQLGTFTINNADQATALGSTPIRWDAAGNLASIGETYNTYSPTNQLIGTTGPDYQLTRVRYLTADQTQPYVQYYDFGGGETQVETYTNTALGVTGVVRNGDRLAFVRDPQGRLLQLVDTDAGTKYYYFLDAQNSTQAIFDGAGHSVAGNTFEPYGYTTTIDLAADTNPFRWLGQFVEGSGQQRFGYRRYNAGLARFTQPEPTELNSALQPDPRGPTPNTYQYAASDPINLTDTPGLQSTLGCVGSIVGVVGTAVGIFFIPETAGTSALIGPAITGSGGIIGSAASCG